MPVGKMPVGDTDARFPYPRRRLMRGFLQWLSRPVFAALTDLEIFGAENFPAKGPLLVVGNHFSFIDPAALVRAIPWPLDFLGGFQMPNGPPQATWLTKLWGYYPVFRGTGSRYALQAAHAVLKQDGILGIFPEGGNWATILRPARPGTAFLAAQTGAPILPVGLDGFLDVFPSLRKGRRAKVTIRIGKPFGPVTTTGSGRERRAQLDEIGHTIMRRIAELIPPEARGHYSDDPAIREAAKGTEIFPWDDEPEG